MTADVRLMQQSHQGRSAHRHAFGFSAPATELAFGLAGDALPYLPSRGENLARHRTFISVYQGQGDEGEKGDVDDKVADPSGSGWLVTQASSSGVERCHCAAVQYAAGSV